MWGGGWQAGTQDAWIGAVGRAWVERLTVGYQSLNLPSNEWARADDWCPIGANAPTRHQLDSGGRARDRGPRLRLPRAPAAVSPSSSHTLKCTLGWKTFVRYRTAGATSGYCSGTSMTSSKVPPSKGVSLGPCSSRAGTHAVHRTCQRGATTAAGARPAPTLPGVLATDASLNGTKEAE